MSTAKDTRLLTLILTTVRNEDSQKLITSTWGNEGGDSLFLTDKHTQHGRQLSLTEDTRYASNEEKVVAGLNYATTLLGTKFGNTYDWVLLCDDDTVPNYTKILDALPGLSPNHVHGRLMYNQWKPDLTLDYPSGGAGALFSRRVLMSLPKCENQQTGFADVSCGLWLRAFNVPIEYAPFRAFHPTMFGIDMFNPEHHDWIRDQWSFHYIKKPNEIVKLHTIFHGEK